MKKLFAASLCTAIVSSAAPAWASGILVARFGGEHGHPTTSNPTAIYYNPAGIALDKGTRIYLDGTFALRHASYDRPVEAIGRIGTFQPDGTLVNEAGEPIDGTPVEAIRANSGKAELTNFVVSPFIAVVSDLGIPNLGVGAAFYVPFGGTAVWGRNEEFEGTELGRKYPGAEDGPQRWFTEDGKIQSLYFTAAGAYRLEGPRLTFGVGLNLINNVLHTVRARNADGTDDLVFATGLPKEGRSLVEASNWEFGLGAGVIWEPMENLWVGASYQSQPGFGTSHLKGTLTTSLAGTTSEEDIEMEQSMPDVLRVGGRWRPDPRWELRLFGEYVRWSVLRQQCLRNTEVEDGKCAFNEDGSAKPESNGAVIQNIPRLWKNAFGIRAGASYWLTPPVELFLGAGFDSNAIPNKTLDPSLYDMNKVTIAGGGHFEILEDVSLMATFTQVIYATRTIEVDESQPFVPPSRQPNSAGTYRQSISVLDVAAQYRF